MRWSILSLVLAVLAACALDVDHRGTHYLCPDERCPAGFHCVGGVCVEEDAGGPGPVDAGAGADASPIDAPPGIDAPLTICELAALASDNDRCVEAIDVTAAALAGGTTVYGDTTSYADNLDPAIPATCTGSPESGPDAIYQLAVQAGDQVHVDLTPEDWNGALYVLDDCASSATCLDGSDGLGVGTQESLDVTPTVAGTLYLVVDSSATSSAGCFVLDVQVIR